MIKGQDNECVSLGTIVGPRHLDVPGEPYQRLIEPQFQLLLHRNELRPQYAHLIQDPLHILGILECLLQVLQVALELVSVFLHACFVDQSPAEEEHTELQDSYEIILPSLLDKGALLPGGGIAPCRC